MDNFFPGNSVINISNGVIDDISFASPNTFVTVTYNDNNASDRRRNEQTVRLVVGNNTIILDENGNQIRPRDLTTGMIINAAVSSAMTRSIPPQTSAFMIRIVRRPRPQPKPQPENITVGRIVDIDRRNRNFTTIHDQNRTSIIRFNVPERTPIFDRNGRPIDFSRLVPGLRVWVRHANFMTASIPPQTTAFEIRVR